MYQLGTEDRRRGTTVQQLSQHAAPLTSGLCTRQQLVPTLVPSTCTGRRPDRLGPLRHGTAALLIRRDQLDPQAVLPERLGRLGQRSRWREWREWLQRAETR